MYSSNPLSLHLTLQQLKEIVVSVQGANHESARLVDSIEHLIDEIERKSNGITPECVPAHPVPALVST